jgi:hypothetical protein
MNRNGSDSQPSPSDITGSSRAGLIRRDFLRSLGLAAVSAGFGQPQSLISRFVNTSPAAAPLLVDCPGRRSVLGLDNDGAEKARRCESDLATFQPWVGENYEAAPFENRTLILGDSPYGWNGGRDTSGLREVTRDIVAEQIEGPFRDYIWAKIASMFISKRPSCLADMRLFWHGVAFYHYLQVPAGSGTNCRPTPAQWKESEAAFLDVLRLIKPQFMLVLGMRLWNNLPDVYRLIESEHGIAQRHYSYPGGSCIAVPVREPWHIVYRA